MIRAGETGDPHGKAGRRTGDHGRADGQVGQGTRESGRDEEQGPHHGGDRAFSMEGCVSRYLSLLPCTPFPGPSMDGALTPLSCSDYVGSFVLHSLLTSWRMPFPLALPST